MQTNVAFLSRLMRDSAFAADLDTGLIERQRDTLLPVPRPAGADALALASAAVLARQGLAQPGAARAGLGRSLGRARRLAPGRPVPPRAAMGGQRRNAPRRHRPPRQGLDPGCRRWPATVPVARAGHAGGAFALRVTLGGHESAGTVALHADRAYVFTDAGSHALELYDPLAHSQDTQGEHGGGLTAPMPGKIISIAVKAGDTVEKGQPLLVMEAMKMEHTISAPADGKVAEVFYAIGDQVTEGAELVAIEVQAAWRAGHVAAAPRRLPARWRDSATINVKAGVTPERDAAWR